MIKRTLIAADEQPLATWRGGTTRAIYAYPPAMLGAMAQAELWVGTAWIERDGPYTLFTDRTRIHLPMRGKGLQLHFEEPTASSTLETFAQATFAGDRPLQVTLVDGAVEAFNLIFQPTVQANLTVLHLQTTDDVTTLPQARSPLAAPQIALQILYLVDGHCTVEEPNGAPTQLSPADAYLCDATEEIRLGGLGANVTLLQAICFA